MGAGRDRATHRKTMVIPGHGISWKDFFEAFKKEWKEDKLTDVAGSLVFFGVLALFPFVLFLVTLAGLVLKPEQVDAFIQQIGQFAPREAVNIIAAQIQDIRRSSNGGLLTIGFVGAIWSASGGVGSLMEALNDVYGVEDKRPFWKKRLIAIGTTIGAGAMVLLAALVAVAAAPLAELLPQPFSTLITWARLPVAGLIMMFTWACLYYFLPDVEQRFKFITPGSVVGVLLWVLASWLFSLYVTKFGSYNKTYGAIGGVIVMLMWMWISTIVLLLGAEINAIIEHLSPEGKKTGAKSMADTGPDVPKTEKKEIEEAASPSGLPAAGVRVVPAYRPRPRAPLIPAAMGLALLFLFGRRRRHG
jgi:membrane protein